MPLLKPVRGTQLNRTHPLARGLVGCWLFNEGSGGKVFDLSGNGNIGTLVGDAHFVPGKFGSGLDFDGSGDYVNCGSSDSLDDVKPVTISCWIHPDSLGELNYGRIIDKGSAFDAGWLLYMYSTSTIKFRAQHVSIFLDVVASDNSISLGTWQHVVVTWDGSITAANAHIYVNGEETSYKTQQDGSGAWNSDAAQNLLIGNRSAGNRSFDGMVDNVMIFKRLLTAAEIALLYQEPFCMFEHRIRPQLMYVPIAVVSLAGSVSAQSAASATLQLLSKISGTVTSDSDVTALLESFRSSPGIERDWLREALFNGMTASALKLGTTLSLGWFWVRVAGCSVLYRGPSMERIDFTNILTVAEQDACAISPPSYILHNSSSTYFYVIRRFNNCGYQEHTLTAAVKVSIGSDGDLAQPRPNKIFASKAEQVNGNAIQLVWFYCPIEQTSRPVRFNVYHDGRTGQIDYENPLATIDYQGRKFYRYQSDALEAGRYLFAVRAEDASGIENSSLAQASIQLDAASLDPIDILDAEGL